MVNTASRRQGHAAAGEVLLSARLARVLSGPVGVPERLALKGKREPFDARRVRYPVVTCGRRPGPRAGA